MKDSHFRSLCRVITPALEHQLVPGGGGEMGERRSGEVGVGGEGSQYDLEWIDEEQMSTYTVWGQLMGWSSLWCCWQVTATTSGSLRSG